ncbi:MAG: D-cysteine desulfhydrase family protein [Armatimonadota bacterium]|nr:D-cysteine desulfhydrase family protein [Armatimonadota bacterium]MDR5697854.1 D-cysteine desulfhydrase family protein [Armatimonadota bacterium]
MLIGDLPRVRLAYLPTPLEEAPRLSEYLGGPRILIKRDDLTGLALGGNKARKLEFLMADAHRRGCDVVVTVGAVQSNHARMTAAAARRLGMTAVLVLGGPQPPAYEGNVLLDNLFGAELRFVDAEEDYVMDGVLEDTAREYQRRGHRPYVIPRGGSNALGAAAYLAAFGEFAAQCNQMGVRPAAVVHTSSSGGTQSGLLTGALLARAGVRVIGVSAGPPREVCTHRIRGIVAEMSERLGLDFRLHEDDVVVHDEFVGPGYAIPTPECIAAIRLVARTEGVLLDPVYTGKGMAGLMAMIRQGRFARDDAVVFWHTGGQPGLFAFRAALEERFGA